MSGPNRKSADILQDDQNLYFDLYGITSQGNWEHDKNIPDINFGEKELAEKYGFSEEAFAEKIESLNKKLFVRARKTNSSRRQMIKFLPPGMRFMAKGYIDAYKAFGEEDFLNSARRNLDFLIEKLCTNREFIIQKL